MMNDSKTSTNLKYSHSIHKSNLELYPSINPQNFRNTLHPNAMNPASFSKFPNIRNLTPATANKSLTFLYPQSNHSMKVVERSSPTLVQILKPDLYPKRKMLGKKLELVGRTVVSTHKAIPKVKFVLPQRIGGDEYLKRIANVKSKYFCYLQQDRRGKKHVAKKRIIRASEVDFSKYEITEKSLPQHDDERLRFTVYSSKSDLLQNNSIALAAWEQETD